MSVKTAHFGRNLGRSAIENLLTVLSDGPAEKRPRPKTPAAQDVAAAAHVAQRVIIAALTLGRHRACPGLQPSAECYHRL
jgi:hypothetical protein